MEVIAENRKEKGTVVFIHGLCSSNRIFDNIIESDLISNPKEAISLIGHGENQELKKTESFLVNDYCTQLIAEINLIDDAVFLVGNSLGGHLAIEIANEIPLLKGLMIMGTPPLNHPLNFEEAFLSLPEMQTFLSENPTDKDVDGVYNVALFNKEVKDKFVKDFKKANPKVRSSAVESFEKGLWGNQKEIFLNLDLPKFIVHGQNDPSVNFKYLKELQKTSRDNCELVVIENCGHYPSIESPKEFIEILSNALKKVF